MNAVLLVIIIGAGALCLLISLFFFVQFNQMVRSTNQRIDNLSTTIIELSKNLGQIQEIAGNTNQRVDNLNNIIVELSKNLGQIQEGARQMLDIGKSIAKLEDLFKGQQFRGRVGEIMLEKLIEDLLPKSYYEFQFQLKNGARVDAAIKFPNTDKILPIDSKFPLSNYEKMLTEKDEKERKKYRDEFIRDVKKRCDEISRKYINPHGGTFDFAFMFIPSESVYYEIIQDGEETLRYMLNRKVIPTSPTTLHFHLLIFMNHFKILEVQKNLDKLIRMLSGLETELIGNAQSKYNQISSGLQNLNILIENFTKEEQLRG